VGPVPDLLRRGMGTAEGLLNHDVGGAVLAYKTSLLNFLPYSKLLVVAPPRRSPHKRRQGEFLGGTFK
jgi:hypothetical protein